MDNDRASALRLMNTLAFIAMIVVNTLADILPIGGVKTGDVSKAYPNLFNPADFTFAIWAVIYLLMAGFVLYQAGIFGEDGGDSGKTVRSIGGWFIASCLFNIGWILTWHNDLILLSTVMMLGLLISTIVIKNRTQEARGTSTEKWFVQAPFSLYFGWITVATIANISVLLVKLRWNGWGISPEIWTAAILIVGAIIAVAAILRGRDWVYGLAVLWAYVGILYKHASADGYGMAYTAVIAAACVCLLAVLVAMAAALRGERERQPEAARGR